MSKLYRQKWPEQEKAKYTVRNRLRRGKLVKSPDCQRCSEPKTPKELEAHHWSYAKEHHADVIWLCVPCHKIVHKELGPDWVDLPARPDLRLRGEAT